jgi:hypothetical protein
MPSHSNSNSPRHATRINGLMPWFWKALVVLAVGLALVLLWHNYSFRRPSRSAFEADLGRARDRGFNWIGNNRIVSERNPAMMYMIADMERMSPDPRLQAVLDHYQKHYLTRPETLLDFAWYRLVVRNADVPVIRVPDMHGELNEVVWDAYAIAADKISLTEGDHASMFSPTMHVWGARQHQLLALAMYRDYNGGSPELDNTMNYLAEKVAREAHFDFRLGDNSIQRTAFVLAARRPDLIRPRWVETMLESQNGDGSWYGCWYGWCRGVLDFNPNYKTDIGGLDHATVQATWALTMLKYRYPQWIDEHYR